MTEYRCKDFEKAIGYDDLDIQDRERRTSFDQKIRQAGIRDALAM